jgi:hypothetical protein
MSEKFEEFWQVWPKHFRKASKSVCLAKWKAKKLDAQAGQIIKHVMYMKGQEAWTKDGGSFIPAPLVYINQARWDGAEIPEIVANTPVRDPAVVKIEQDAKKAVPMPDHIRKKLQELRRTPLTA